MYIKIRTKEDSNKNIDTPRMVCTRCKNVELVMPTSRETGLCNPCRERLTPKYISDCQYDTYWDLYSKKEIE